MGIKKLLDIKSIVWVVIVMATLIYYGFNIFCNGEFTIDNKALFYIFAMMVFWALAYLLFHIKKLNNTVKTLHESNQDIKLLLNTILSNQAQCTFDIEKVHKNTRILMIKLNDEILQGLAGGTTDDRTGKNSMDK